MTYRSNEAQAVHTSILSYLRKGEDYPFEEEEVRNAIDKLDENSLLELSTKGHSHLIDILHLPFELALPAQAVEKCTFLMQKIFAKASSLGGNVGSRLLTQKDNFGDTPLHSLLKSGNSNNMQLYFTEVRNGVTHQWIKKDEYIELLLKPNNAGFTPLHTTLISGNPENMQAYFTEMRYAITKGWIKQDEYADLLLKPNKAGFTPLDTVLI